jgi:hypothetical protein
MLSTPPQHDIITTSSQRKRRQRLTASSAAEHSRQRRAFRAFLVAGLIALGFTAGRWSASHAGRSEPSRELAPAAQASTAHVTEKRGNHRSVKRPYLIRRVELLPSLDPDAEKRYEQQQSRDLLGLLRRKLDVNKRLNFAANPEGVASAVFPYMQGLADGIVRTAPDLVDALAAEIEGAMCHPGTSAAELIGWSHLIANIPELANPKTFDCLFSLHPEENTVLWYGIDAWRTTELPKPEPLAAIERSAQDPRTRRRFLSPEQEAAQARQLELAAKGPPRAPHPTGPLPRQGMPSASKPRW